MASAVVLPGPGGVNIPTAGPPEFAACLMSFEAIEKCLGGRNWADMIQRSAWAVARFCRGVANSEVGWLVVVLHAALLILAIANMSPPDREFAHCLDRLYASGGWCSATVYAGRPFHSHYESLALKLTIIADLPALLVSSPAELLLQSMHLPRVSLYVQSYFDSAFQMLFGTLQWLIVGYMAQRHLAPDGRG